MTLYALFFRFVDGKIETMHFSVKAREFAQKEGWEYIGSEPDGIEDVRITEEHQWDRALKERR